MCFLYEFRHHSRTDHSLLPSLCEVIFFRFQVRSTDYCFFWINLWVFFSFFFNIFKILIYTPKTLKKNLLTHIRKLI